VLHEVRREDIRSLNSDGDLVLPGPDEEVACESSGGEDVREKLSGAEGPRVRLCARRRMRSVEGVRKGME
jgi:hypothetical protein